MNIARFVKNRPFLTILTLIVLVSLVDVTNLDSALHKGLCTNLGRVFKTVCTDFYDLPIWEVAVAFGTLAAVYYAYSAIRESNERLRLEQEPDVRLKDRIVTASPLNQLHIISLKNFGKGRATNITATADPEGEISIIEGSNPHSIDLGPNDHNTGWAIDEFQVLKGLAKQGIVIRPTKNGTIPLVVQSIPDENRLPKDQKNKADFYLYLWYEDQLGNKYRTTAKIRHSGYFLKVMENKVERL